MVPHIGFTAKTKFLSRQALRDRSAPNPKYDYKKETQKVIKRLKELAINDTQKMLVEFFDNKLLLGITTALNMAKVVNFTYEDR